MFPQSKERDQGVGAGQAAHMGREDSFRAALHGIFLLMNFLPLRRRPAGNPEPPQPARVREPLTAAGVASGLRTAFVAENILTGGVMSTRERQFERLERVRSLFPGS